MPPAALGVRVYWEVSSGLYAAGPPSFVGELLTRWAAGVILPACLGLPKINPGSSSSRTRRSSRPARARNAGAWPAPGLGADRRRPRGRICVFSNGRATCSPVPALCMAEAAQIVARCLKEKFGS